MEWRLAALAEWSPVAGCGEDVWKWRADGAGASRKHGPHGGIRTVDAVRHGCAQACRWCGVAGAGAAGAVAVSAGAGVIHDVGSSHRRSGGSPGDPEGGGAEGSGIRRVRV